jgi:lipopolysaccharide assembly protein A
MRLIAWVLRGIIFFTLFAFALNNQQPATVHWFFGFEWQAPLVIIVLAAVGAGAALGVSAMLPNWWRARRAPGLAAAPNAAAAGGASTSSTGSAAAAPSLASSLSTSAATALGRPATLAANAPATARDAQATAADRRVPPAHDGLGI